MHGLRKAQSNNSCIILKLPACVNDYKNKIKERND